MSYTIYAIVVTILFGIYLAVQISMDVLGPRKAKGESAEEFDNSAFASEETSTMVQETSSDGEFRFQHPEGSDSKGERPESPLPECPADAVAADSEEEQPQAVNERPDPLVVEQPGQTESPNENSLYEKVKEVHDKRCTVIVPAYQSEYDSESFALYWSNHTLASSRIAARMITC